MRRLAVIISVLMATSAMASESDRVDGFITNDFLRALPTQADSLTRKGLQSNPGDGRVSAEYANGNQSRKAQVLIYRVPEGVEADDYVATVLDSTEEAMKSAGAQPSRRNYRSLSDVAIQCLDGNQKRKVLHSVCLASLKGRVVDVQPLAVATSGINKKAFEESNDFVSTVMDAVAAL